MVHQNKRVHNHSCGSVQRTEASPKTTTNSRFSKQNSRKKNGSRSKKVSMVRVKNNFDRTSHPKIPANSISSILLNDSLDAFRQFSGATINDEDRTQNTNKLLRDAYRDNLMELSESSLSPTRGLKRGYLGSSQKSPLYTLNSTKAWAKKYNHLLQRYKSKHIERSSSANTAMSEREISKLKDSNASLLNENDVLNREVYNLV